MPLHQNIQRLLLLGVKLGAAAPPAVIAPPRRLKPLIDSLAAAHGEADKRAIRFGHRYRSGFWAIYLLSAIAVFCAVIPMALGWDTLGVAMHPFAGVWVVAEVIVIGSVCVIYWRGHQSDWQGEWLRARTTAELTAYLPMVAPLVNFSEKHTESDWYLRVLDPGQYVRGLDAIVRLCAINEARTAEHLDQAWSDPEFVSGYARWAAATLQAQECYHARVAVRSHALLHRVHRLTSVLFALTAVSALAHLFVHSRWLTLLTTFFPALAASLHGALAQSEAYRLHVASERMAENLRKVIGGIRAALSDDRQREGVPDIRNEIKAAIALVLEEHQDWHMLVRPHHLPLA